MPESVTDMPSLELRHRHTALSRYRDLVDDWEAFCAALSRPLAPCVWANPQRIDSAALAALFAGEGIAATPLPWHPQALRLAAQARPGQHWGLVAGLYQTQEEVSLLPVKLLDPQPGERVLDLCAAPGNKTAHAALAMNNTGTLIANDVSRGRLAALRFAVKRLGLLNVGVVSMPGQSLPLAAGPFDRVLVDAPCSCEGTVRKSPGSARIIPEQRRARMVRRQIELLVRAVELCRPGGRVVYSTCTFAPEENEGVVDTVLRRFGADLRLRPARIEGFHGAPGLAGWEGRTYSPELTRTLRVWPHHNDTGGFFVAVLERIGGGDGEAATEFLPPAGEEQEPAGAFGRFAMPDHVFAGLIRFRLGRKYLQLAAADFRPPPGLRLEFAGLPVVRAQSRPVKPTTAAAMHFGCYAQRNLLDLETVQVRAYLERQVCWLPPERCRACDVPGYVLLRYQGRVLGVGELKRQDERGIPMISLFPKAWMNAWRVPPQGMAD